MNKITIIVLIALMGSGFRTFAQGDLLITPKRVIFDGSKQKAELSLVNVGKDTAIYSVTFLQYNMTEDGSLVTIQEPDSGQRFADPYLRIYPRTVTLAPGEPQVIALQYRRKADMPAGEYRSHIYFRAEKNNAPLGYKQPAKDTTLMSVQLIPVYGISIPVIIRTGTANVSCSLTDLKLETQRDIRQSLTLTINRKGNISVYGDFYIEYIPQQGKPYEISAIKGVGVYTNINKRKISIKLNNTSGQPIAGGKLKVQYVSNDDNKKVVYAEGELVVE